MKNLQTFEEFVNEGGKANAMRYFKAKERKKLQSDARKYDKKRREDVESPEDLELRTAAKIQKESMLDEPGYKPHKLKNSRLVMKTRDELYYMQSHQLEKLLDKVNAIKNKLQDKYNYEQERHNRFNIMDSLSADLTYLRSYAKIINYFIN